SNMILTLLISLAGRIIGGWEARPHSRPYMVNLSINNKTDSFRCGGFLIREDAVLSAAHCVTGIGKVNITVTLGAHNLRKEEPSQQKFHVGHWVIHPKYLRGAKKNDIVLLKLNRKADLNHKVSCIALPSQNQHVKQGSKCNVAGWGWTSMTGAKTSVLMEVNLKVQSEEVCEESFNKRYLQQSMVCVGDGNSKKATFCGDSGGPLVCNGKAHGIVSFGPKSSTFPNVFTRVSYFVPWIHEELRKFALQDPTDPSS
ncbi:DDN1 protein, partial [Trogon melanurus]|nr:DDN1 protein [Trogon melanurus]